MTSDKHGPEHSEQIHNALFIYGLFSDLCYTLEFTRENVGIIMA